MKTKTAYSNSINKRDIFDQARNGDKLAVNKAIEAFTPMVHMWVNSYKFMCPNMQEDLVQDGILGIVEAIKTFDPDLRTASGKPVSPSTWVWWKTRQAVQSSARKYKGLPTVHVIDEHIIDSVEDSNARGYSSESLMKPLEEIILKECESMSTSRAEIVKDRFGLKGAAPMNQAEIARKHGISKQAISSHLTKFYKVVKTKYPELRSLIN